MSVPLSELVPPAPSTASECVPPWNQRGDGQHSLADEGAGRANSDDWKEILALCILCGPLPSQYGRYFAASEMLPGSLFHVGRNQKHNGEFYICTNYAAPLGETQRRVTQMGVNLYVMDGPCLLH